ncbi:hypothetical protein Scep_019014 [Stephania cephalantha]|uniref:Protein kinase domain-containing protein n=1 Tax=Stephania cephalantha TaxID=152367 RepID=A0AAP0IAB4_9MAGN
MKTKTINEAELGGGTVVVGLKLDKQSRELLTWALVNAANPGDRVVAVHVIDSSGESPLLSLVSAFDSVISVYEGFCSLKQIDLKLKICRGSSIKKNLVREAKSYVASKVIVGTSRSHCSTSVAKYCARNLPSVSCSVAAVDNGKVVFQRGAVTGQSESSEHQVKKLLGMIHRKLSKSSRSTMKYLDSNQEKNWELLKSKSDCLLNLVKPSPSCSFCISRSVSLIAHFARDSEEECDGSNGGKVDDSMALVPVQTKEVAASSVSSLLKPGWPLLRQAVLPEKKASVRRISVVQWAMQLPTRHSLSMVYPDQKQVDDEQKNSGSSSLDGESGAIVPVGNDYNAASSPLTSPDQDQNKRLPKVLESLHEKYSSTCRLFSYQELESATSKFSPDKLIGKGGSSQVYRGSLPDGKELAVKILKPSEEAVKEFVLEIEIITALQHKNIVSLFGFCYDNNKLLLVYDFLSRGSLEENLHGNKNEKLSFGWEERYKVAIGVAEALEYLHGGCAKPVIHRDVKSSNILLSDDFDPQLSDFGLATWASTSSSHVTCTDVAGTFGYLAPEYFMYGKVNEKIDVYAFGVVLLELLSGRKPISNDSPKGQESLVMWAKPILNGGKPVQLLDPVLADNCNHDQMERIAIAAALCIRRAPRARPRMSIILKLLQGDLEVTKWARQQFSASEELDGLDDEILLSPLDIKSHLNLALLDVEDDSLSISSIEQSISWEDYLQGRWSRSSSFD